MNAWTLITALPILVELESRLKHIGFHVALGGSVLYTGASKKDLDIIVFPHQSKGASTDDWTPAQQALENFFDCRIKLCVSRNGVERDAKRVFWLRDSEGRRVDFFFLS